MDAEPEHLRPEPRRRRSLLAVVGLLILVTLVAFVLRETSGSSLPAVPVSDSATDGTTVKRYTVKSTAADRKLVQTVILPSGDLRGRPLLVFLHGKSQDPARLAGAHMRAAVARLGAKAPIVLLPADDGGSYWHDRRSGRWERYVMTEAIPAAIERYGADAERVAIGGISMGGAGAFALAQHHPGRFCAVGGHSPALWPSFGATAPGAYDDRNDFARNDPVGPVLRATARYRTKLWVDAGRTDPFGGTVGTFADALRRNREQITVRRWAGGHEGRYWQTHMAAYFRFYAGALEDC